MRISDWSSDVCSSDLYNTDVEYCRDPHARAADLVANAPPIFWTPFNGGHWMFQEHKAVSEALRDYATFSSEHFSPDAFAAMMAELPEEERVPAPVPIAIDPQLHTKLDRKSTRLNSSH